MEIPLYYGRARAPLDLEKKSVQWRLEPPRREDSRPVSEVLASAIECPLEAPPFHRAFTPDDHVAIVVDPQIPFAASLVHPLIDSLVHRAGIDLARVTILAATSFREESIAEFRSQMPPEFRNVTVAVHDPSKAGEIAYLASTVAGQRIYLNRHIVEADAFVVVSRTGFDALTGRTGPASLLYPWLSKVESLAHARLIALEGGQSSSSLFKRQECEEVARLAGLFYSLGVSLGAEGNVERLWFGRHDAVQKAADEHADAFRTIHVKRPDADLVIAVCSPAATECTWSGVGAALEAASHLVRPDEGKIALVTDLVEPPGAAVEELRDSDDPWDALGRMRESNHADSLAASQMAHTLSSARVYLLSQLAPDLVESLGMVPLSTVKEISNLARSMQRIALLESADCIQVPVSRKRLYRRT